MPFETYTHVAKDVIDYVKTQFGDEADIQITDAHIIRWINAGQREIIQKNTTINEVKVSTAVVSGQGEYNLPSTFADMLLVNSLLYDGALVEKTDFNSAMNLVSSTPSATGAPSVWWVKANTLNLYPVPDVDIASGLTLYYTKSPTAISNTGDALSVPDNYFNALVQYVIKQAYELDENFQAAAAKQSEFVDEINSQQNQTSDHGNSFPVIQYDEGDVW